MTATTFPTVHLNGTSTTETGIGLAQIVTLQPAHVRGYTSGSGYFVPQ